jgi:hypothetical protein
MAAAQGSEPFGVRHTSNRSHADPVATLFYSHTRFNDDAICWHEPVKGSTQTLRKIKNAENHNAMRTIRIPIPLQNYQIAKNSKIGADVSYVINRTSAM